jgi:hypothetical protein
MTTVPKCGTIEKTDNGFVVRVPNKAYLLDIAGVTCDNPEAEEPERIYTRRFVNKRIYLPHEYDRAVKEVLAGTDTYVLGVTGYSKLTDLQCLEYGVAPGAYEAACEGLLKSVVWQLRDAFPGINVRFADGASEEWTAGHGRPVGIDSVILKVAKDLNIPHLGHSCPEFMFYVPDDNEPVYVAESQDEYSRHFVQSVQVLIAANGRKQAFEMDINAVFHYHKHLIPVNVLRAISSNGGPAALDAKGNINDAVAHFEQRLHVASQAVYGGSDRYKSMVEHVQQTATYIGRSLISPTRAFGEIR